ncbi:hypothetical protein GIB67_039787 [Kingdonia uniflora]|uniref:Uncharacterized protein n=1 Tax=Kingdonia uniflora TaxID=39325 RepID=A0A7J7P303_9MAGN|nr:hypothetical protein GIB67_039787 [Kingdonia uniflora]
MKVHNEYELPLAAKDQVLIGTNMAGKNKKCELRKVYDKYPTNDVRKRNYLTTTIQKDWERSEDPKTVRTDYFLAGCMYSDGSFLTLFPKAKVLYPHLVFAAEIKSNAEKNPESKHYDVDDDRTLIKEGKLAYKEIDNKLNAVIDEVKTLKENATREGQRTQNASPYHNSEDEVVAVGREIFPHNQTNNHNKSDVLVDLVIDEDAEVSGRRGMLFHDIPMGEWFKYLSFLLKIIDEDCLAYLNLPSETIGIFDRVSLCSFLNLKMYFM